MKSKAKQQTNFKNVFSFACWWIDKNLPKCRRLPPFTSIILQNANIQKILWCCMDLLSLPKIYYFSQEIPPSPSHKKSFPFCNYITMILPQAVIFESIFCCCLFVKLLTLFIYVCLLENFNFFKQF